MYVSALYIGLAMIVCTTCKSHSYVSVTEQPPANIYMYSSEEYMYILVPTEHLLAVLSLCSVTAVTVHVV